MEYLEVWKWNYQFNGWHNGLISTTTDSDSAGEFETNGIFVLDFDETDW